MAKDNLVKERIKELGEKSSQTLLFLSFALVVVATLKDKSNPTHQVALKEAMRCWSWALFPVLLGIVPLKEAREENARWYEFVRWFKVVLLWLAIIIIARGAWEFLQAIQEVFSS